METTIMILGMYLCSTEIMENQAEKNVEKRDGNWVERSVCAVLDLDSTKPSSHDPSICQVLYLSSGLSRILELLETENGQQTWTQVSSLPLMSPKQS